MSSTKYDKLITPLKVRQLQVMMLYFAMQICFSMRINVNMAMAAIQTDPEDENSFNWSNEIQGVILSSFFWGYVVLQIPGGELAARFGGMILITLCVAINSAVSLLIPLAGRFGGWQLMCTCRVIQGLSQGVLFPSVHTLIGKWIPVEERNRMGSVIYSGAQLGVVLQLTLTELIADYWGWPVVFYVNGTAGAVWTVGYMFLGSDSPQRSKMISVEERSFIHKSLGHVGNQQKLETPWMSIWTSLPFISLIIAHCGFTWGYWTLLNGIPSYMSLVLGIDIKENAVLLALPYMAMFTLNLPFGYILDFTLIKKKASISACRKVCNSIGFFGPAIALVALSHVPTGDVTTAVVLLTAVVGLSAGHYTGFLLAHLDMAPNFAGTLMGITNCLANLVSLTTPLVTGALIPDETNPADWMKVFYVTAAVYVISNTFYLKFGSSERQKWNDPSIDSRDS